jgi:hypothetical protein
MYLGTAIKSKRKQQLGGEKAYPAPAHKGALIKATLNEVVVHSGSFGRYRKQQFLGEMLIR